MAEVRAFLFGISLAITIGPIAILILNIAAKDGLAAGVRSAFGAGVADFTLALAAFVGGVALTRFLQAARKEIEIASSVVLILLGVWLLLRSLKFPADSHVDKTETLQSPFFQTYALTLVNPLGLIAFAAFSTQLPIADSILTAFWFALFLFGGSLMIQVLLAFSGRALRLTFISPRRLMLLNLASAIAIACYGLFSFLRAARIIPSVAIHALRNL